MGAPEVLGEQVSTPFAGHDLPGVLREQSGRLRIDNLIVQSPRDRECDRAMAPDGGI